MFSQSNRARRYLHDGSDFQSKILNHQLMLPLQLLRDGRAMYKVGEAIQKSKTPPQGRAVVEGLCQHWRQSPFQAFHRQPRAGGGMGVIKKIMWVSVWRLDALRWSHGSQVENDWQQATAKYSFLACIALVRETRDFISDEKKPHAESCAQNKKMVFELVCNWNDRFGRLSGICLAPTCA